MTTEANDSSVHTASWDFKKVMRSITVDVYLPKNLINYGTLIDLLGEVLEFDQARDDLVHNVEKLLPIITEQFSGLPKVESLHLAADPEVPVPVDQLRSRLGKMEKRIEGYSIFEADGAFEHDWKGNTIPVYGGNTFTHTPSAQDHFENCKLPEWLRDTAEANPEDTFIRELIQRLQIEGSSASLKEDVSRPNRRRRILSYETMGVAGERHNFIVSYDDNGEVRMRKCIRLLEERTLVIKFIAYVEDDKSDWLPTTSMSTKAEDVLWDVVVLIGCFFARKLGESGEGLEDQIWIAYDCGNLWKWQGGRPAKTNDVFRNLNTVQDNPSAL